MSTQENNQEQYTAESTSNPAKPALSLETTVKAIQLIALLQRQDERNKEERAKNGNS